MNYDKCPKCGGEVWLVEYSYDSPEHYDGTSEYACKQSLTGEGKSPCDWRIGRFCGKPLRKNEIERRYCTGTGHPMHAETTPKP